MQEIYKILIGIAVVALGFPLGIFLAKATKEELKKSQKWFKLIIAASFAGAIVSIIISNDTLFFSFLFFAAVTSMSLAKTKNKK